VAASDYETIRISPRDPAMLRQADVERSLRKLADGFAGRLNVSKFAESYEKRAIYLATIGSGPKRVLLWSQMHGDEPTHTAVLLDLLSYLLQTPSKSQAKDILAACTLSIIPMLNPDGAEAVTRYNAQHIDINRDALRLQTPEGRALLKAAETLKPEFGFNLHNQNARAAVGTPPEPAVIAVMAPAGNPTNTELPHVRRAKQLALCVVEAVRPSIGDRISRYTAEYMPWAFGETIQSRGTATVLIEAGGWTDRDPTPMVEVHFNGLLGALHAIATDAYLELDPAAYDVLPGPNGAYFFDAVVRGGHILDSKSREPVRADLAINQSQGSRLPPPTKPDGKISDLGDLGNGAGKQTLDASGCLILPGQIAVVEAWNAAAPPNAAMFDELLAAGITSAIGVVNIADRDALEALAKPHSQAINLGYIVRLDDLTSLAANERLERLLLATSQGALAFIGDGLTDSERRYLDWFGVPVLQSKQLQSSNNSPQSYTQFTAEAAERYNLLGLDRSRGAIRRDKLADLLFFDLGDSIDASSAVDWRRLKRVVVAGDTVWLDGKRTAGNPGTLVKRAGGGHA
jgi:hypothetical protein